MNKKIYFLSGLPRSGSTLLSAILNQNPLIYASPTSGLPDLLGTTLNVWYNKVNEVQGRDNDELFRLLKSLVISKYSTIEKPIIFDKSRSWSASETMKTMSKVLDNDVKVIATVRPVTECASSFVRVVNPEDTKEFLRNSQVIQHLKSSYITLYEGYSTHPDNFLFVEYHKLVEDPKKELDRIHKFLDLPLFDYRFDNVDGNVVKERDDEVWNIKGLHDIKPIVKVQNNYNCQEILGDLYYDFDQDEFWIKERKVKNDFLAKQVDLTVKGKFEESYNELINLEKNHPNNNKILFNKAWFLLREGKLLEGHKHFFKGREEGAYGDNKKFSNKPIWDGKSKGTVLFVLEGGLGDQIHYIRFVKDIISKGCKVIVACANELMELFKDIDTRIFIINKNSTFGVLHDYWVPSMSVIIPLNFEYENISGKPYIKKYKIKTKKDKLKIGLRWRGNPNFLKDDDRTFPSKLLFDAVRDDRIEFVSLQRDIDVDLKPNWVTDVNLENWLETKKSVSDCDLVITSCTSICHLSAAMGIPTWVVVPIFPYYFWCLPGDKTPYYDSVKIFRQKKYGNWSEPFDEIHEELQKLINDKNYKTI